VPNVSHQPCFFTVASFRRCREQRTADHKTVAGTAHDGILTAPAVPHADSGLAARVRSVAWCPTVG